MSSALELNPGLLFGWLMTARSQPNNDQIEELYSEALVLADQLATAFPEPGQTNSLNLKQADEALAVACERVRTAVLIKDATRWLRCRRAGSRELRTSLGKQLKRSNLAWLSKLPASVHKVVAETEELFVQIVELDQAWYDQRDPAKSNVIYLDVWASRASTRRVR